MVKASSALLIAASLLAPAVVKAGDECTIMYSLDVAFRVTDTDFGKGDVDVPVKGTLLLELTANDDAKPIDGDVAILFFAMYEGFTVKTVVDVTTDVHHFAPRCNGNPSPGWQAVTKPGFPKLCQYRGNQRALATGELELAKGLIEWDRCNAPPEYWSKDRGAYTGNEKARGKGCLSKLHALGNVVCDGRLGCKLGGLQKGDNPVDLSWSQPLIPGPSGTPATLTISSDLSTITSPPPTEGGHGSYNLPNDTKSRVWFSFKGTRDETSPHTTCR